MTKSMATATTSMTPMTAGVFFVAVLLSAAAFFFLVRSASGSAKVGAAAAAASGSNTTTAAAAAANTASSVSGGGKGGKGGKRGGAKGVEKAKAKATNGNRNANANDENEHANDDSGNGASSGISNSNSAGKKTRKKKKKKKPQQPPQPEGPAATKAVAPEATATAAAVATAAAAAAATSTTESESDEAMAQRMQRQFNAEAEAGAGVEAPADDGWSAVVDTKGKKNKRKKGRKVAASESAAVAANGTTATGAPAVSFQDQPLPQTQEQTQEQTQTQTQAVGNAGATEAAGAVQQQQQTAVVSVDAKKIGVVIGPKGETMQAIEAATNTSLDINAPPRDGSTPANATATVVITGANPSDIKSAKRAISDLCSKGYAALLEGEGFRENYASVHPRYLSEIVGSGGATIRAIQTTLNVKITIPKTDWNPKMAAHQAGKVQNVRVGVAGSKDGCIQAKQVIQSIVRHHHHDITHPGLIHKEVDVPPEFYHCVIGRGGSEIKHIRGNYQCDVYLPNEDSNHEQTLVVGRHDNVERAIVHINNLMDRDHHQRQRKYDDDEY